ncbi:MotA/TolQ/ExbB proton channel family protein [Reichenbachiella agarivorans]|uniref:MotA/TolQ/ExbB proton channel family protein n=1 Tax=Reichenbachiella agarivorans TaxID=2979464 RepID=A0ABY6CUM0_9BACT|nr:MotA/TolQ/ExbB proton channel family protein [Reichenbachiella agarivorans]UXP33143.1 MotA/TolQ/ExbB proton channel family protein [Reichenbachiella agarivorans]
MVDLFYMGGSLFMGILTLLLLVIIVVMTIQVVVMLKQKESFSMDLGIIKSIGTFAMVFGVLGQFIGLYAAFQSIEVVGQVSQALLASGLKVSSITSIYGILIFLISYLLWFGLKALKANFQQPTGV